MEILGQHILKEQYEAPRETITLERVDYETRDSLFTFVEPTNKGSFFQVRKMVNRPRPRSINPRMLLQTQIFLMPYKIEYIRRIFGIANLMSECGGFLKALTICCFIINYPISRHLFYVHIIKQLFFARTSDENLMKPIPKRLSENEKRRMKYLQ